MAGKAGRKGARSNRRLISLVLCYCCAQRATEAACVGSKVQKAGGGGEGGVSPGREGEQWG